MNPLLLVMSLLHLVVLGGAGPQIEAGTQVQPQPLMVEADAEGRIEILARGMHNDTGRMLAMLYDSSEGFPRDLDACADYRTAAISNGKSRTHFAGLEAGTYAVLVIHDEDSDGYLKTNLLGMPKEGVGVSNNSGGIPKFKRAQFELGAGARIEQTIEIRYL